MDVEILKSILYKIVEAIPYNEDYHESDYLELYAAIDKLE